MLTLLDRYIGRSMLLGTLLVFGVFTALFVFVVLVEALGDYGKGNFGLSELFSYVVLSQPRKLYEIFPVTVLIGTLLGLSTLALNSELIAMRAAGVSKARIVGSTMKTGILLVVVAILAGEYVVPGAETRAQIGRAQALEMNFKQGNTGLWLRDGATFVNIGEVLPDLSLLRVSIYDVAPDFSLYRHAYATSAVYTDYGWKLKQVDASRITSQRIETERTAEAVWNVAFTPAVVAVFTTRPEALSITQLYAYIRHLRANNQDVGRYVLTFWQKCLMPFAAALMVVLAAPFVFRPARSGGLAQRAFIGVVIGLAFVVVNRSLGYLGLIYGAPPLAAAVAPLIIFCGVAAVLMRRIA
jgi:lipopolysaccharide export system permease protein